MVFGDVPGFLVLSEKKPALKYNTSKILAIYLENRFFLIFLPQLHIFIDS